MHVRTVRDVTSVLITAVTTHLTLVGIITCAVAWTAFHGESRESGSNNTSAKSPENGQQQAQKTKAKKKAVRHSYTIPEIGDLFGKPLADPYMAVEFNPIPPNNRHIMGKYAVECMA